MFVQYLQIFPKFPIKRIQILFLHLGENQKNINNVVNKSTFHNVNLAIKPHFREGRYTASPFFQGGGGDYFIAIFSRGKELARGNTCIYNK
jgi:hypothetical protein